MHAAVAADHPETMSVSTLSVECLGCGHVHEASATRPLTAVSDVCPRCGYAGWAPVTELSESVRRILRERPPEARRLRAVA